MLKFLFALVLFAVIVITLLKYVRKDSEEFVDDEPQNEEGIQEFPTLNETVQVPPQEEVVKKEYFDLNGEPYEVFTSEGGSKYILRLRTRDNSPYKDYLSEKEKELIYEK